MATAVKAAIATAITLLIGTPDPFALMETGLTIPDDARTATPSPRYRRRNQNESDEDWDAYKERLKADSNGRQFELLASVFRAIIAGADVTVIVAQGATDYGQDLFADVADPNMVLTFIERARKNGAKIVDVEPLLSARVTTLSVLKAPTGQDSNPPI